jgi:hypothetical protein
MSDFEYVALIGVEQVSKYVTDDGDVAKLLKLVAGIAQPVWNWMKKSNPGSRVVPDGMCLEVARHVRHRLQRSLPATDILEGDVELGPNDWLEHFVVRVRLPRRWVVIDFAAGQLPWMAGVQVVVLLVPPLARALVHALHKELHWWVQS